MDIAALSMAALATVATPQDPPGRAKSDQGGTPVARRSPGGATAIASVSVRIISNPATVGHGRGPPLPHMIPRVAIISAADNSPVAALIYDFE